MTHSDIEETQNFTILNRLVIYTGKRLTPVLVEEIYEELKKDMHKGPTSWAFGELKDDRRPTMCNVPDDVKTIINEQIGVLEIGYMGEVIKAEILAEWLDSLEDMLGDK